MSKEELHSIAQRDTPPEIMVPDTWPALIIWAVGKFGVGFLFAIVLALATQQVYLDMRGMNEKVLAAFENSARSQAETTAAIRDLTRAVDTKIPQGRDSIR